MRRPFSTFGLVIWLVLGLSSASFGFAPPRAAQIEHQIEQHGDRRQDPYFWLKDRQNPKVIAYLEQENAYAAAAMKPTEALQSKLLEEMKGHIAKEDTSAPFMHHGYLYYRKTVDKGEYPLYCRRKGSMNGAEEILVDGNKRGKGFKYFSLASPELSPDERYLAYAIDTQGRRFYTLEVYERKSGRRVLSMEKTTGQFTWAADSKHLFYVRQDPDTLRSYQVLRRDLSAPQSELVYEEKDETFSLELRKSTSERYIFIDSDSTTTSETLFLKSAEPKAAPEVFQARERDHKYSIEDGGDRFFVKSNLDAKNFQIFDVPESKTERAHWKPLVAHRPDVFIDEMTVLSKHFILSEREKGLTHLRVYDRQSGRSHRIPFADSAYLAGAYTNADFDTQTFLYSYESMTQPESVFAYDLTQEKSVLVKQAAVPNYDPTLYTTERVSVKARDGTEVPMSIVYKKGMARDSKNPALVYGYGSYGYSTDPTFSARRVSLLDRGFIIALAHIRGGSELGRAWYDDGKLLKKKHTFEDFIDCTEWLVNEKWTSPDRLFAMGGSAGGLLMGAVANMRPDLYRGIVAQVPFVDVVTTMLDASIPLTTAEYDEWGDPRQKVYYDYMLSYSPYDNVKAQNYPNMLVTTGLHDSQVQYWEPAKWVARLRERNKAPTQILLKTNMSAGHSGASGRFASLKEVAQQYAFILHLAGRS